MHMVVHKMDVTPTGWVMMVMLSFIWHVSYWSSEDTEERKEKSEIKLMANQKIMATAII